MYGVKTTAGSTIKFFSAEDARNYAKRNGGIVTGADNMSERGNRNSTRRLFNPISKNGTTYGWTN